MQKWSEERKEQRRLLWLNKGITGKPFSGGKPDWKGRKHTNETKLKMSKAHTGKVLSEETKEKLRLAFKGEKSFFWKGGIKNNNDQIRHSNEYRTWRRRVCKRDKYSCQICKQSFPEVKIDVDHIKSFSLYPELRFDIDNGRVLCKDCHRKTDNYGYKANIVNELAQ